MRVAFPYLSLKQYSTLMQKLPIMLNRLMMKFEGYALPYIYIGSIISASSFLPAGKNIILGFCYFPFCPVILCVVVFFCRHPSAVAGAHSFHVPSCAQESLSFYSGDLVLAFCLCFLAAAVKGAGRGLRPSLGSG